MVRALNVFNSDKATEDSRFKNTITTDLSRSESCTIINEEEKWEQSAGLVQLIFSQLSAVRIVTVPLKCLAFVTNQYIQASSIFLL